MALPFRSRTQAVLVRVLEQAYSHTELSTLFMEAEVGPWEGSAQGSKQQRAQRLLGRLADDDGAETVTAGLDLVRLVLLKGTRSSAWSRSVIWLDELVTALAADGFEWNATTLLLQPAVPGLSVVAETSWVEQQLTHRGWSVAAGHYRQALEGYATGRWASANGQLRNLVEALLPFAAELVSGNKPTTAQAVLDALRSAKMLVKGEYGLAKGLWDLPASRRTPRPIGRGRGPVPPAERYGVREVPAHPSPMTPVRVFSRRLLDPGLRRDTWRSSCSCWRWTLRPPTPGVRGTGGTGGSRQWARRPVLGR